MNQIDRLIIEAKRISGLSGKHLELARIEYVSGEWVSFAHIWDGVEGHAPTIEQAYHTTMDAAIDCIHDLATQYPNSRDVTILIDDI
ncbi:MAG: hypothetical protein VB096_10345 [Pseudoflavonifractor sp.]|nr:hypothetical protein [Pseudoflavonifractor sp.]